VTDPKPYRVLALDGGGFRGLYTATLLEELGRFFAADPAPDLGRRFDLITGTSTGGILACGLAAGVSPRRIIELYEKKGPKIFANPLPVRLFGKLGWALRNAFHAANPAAPLKDGLVEIFGDKTLANVYTQRRIALCLPSIRMVDEKSKVFKTPHDKRFVIDGNYTLVDVCLATSAAPVFLPIHVVEDAVNHDQCLSFADGGLWANNPTLVALIEALEICHELDREASAKRPIEILSIGTCSVTDGDAVDAKIDRGLFDWWGGIKTTRVAMNAQAAAARYMANLLAQRITELGRTVRLIRIEDPPISADQARHLHLDLATPESIQTLKQLGSTRAQAVMSDSSNPHHSDGQFIKRIFSN
jgi:uncharacterized protein